MTTATESRLADLREEVAEAERQMGIHPLGSPMWSTWMARCGKARREMRQLVEEEGR